MQHRDETDQIAEQFGNVIAYAEIGTDIVDHIATGPPTTKRTSFAGPTHAAAHSPQILHPHDVR